MQALDISLIRHERELEYRAIVDRTVVARDALLSYYRNVREQLRLPDLTAMVQVGENQFPEIHSELIWLSEAVGIKPPRLFIYQAPGQYFGVNAEGLADPWIELHAYCLEEMTTAELRFLLARELVHMKNDYPLYEVLVAGMLDAARYLNRVPGLSTILGIVGPERIAEGLKLVLYRYTRAASHTADRGALVLTGDLEVACRAIMLRTLRSRSVADRASMSDWYAQGAIIDGMTGLAALKSKLDEVEPYGVHRIRDLLGFASRRSTKTQIEVFRRLRQEEFGQ
jgi:hypothetical protein